MDRLAQAVSAALAEHDPADVRAGVLGVAGAGAAGIELAQGQAAEAWQRVGLRGSPSSSPTCSRPSPPGRRSRPASCWSRAPGGCGCVIDRQVVRQADGAGWLVGDIGSAVWLAREALVAVVAAWTDVARPPT